MRGLVIGGAGFIGSHFAELLLKNGIKVLVLDNLGGAFIIANHIAEFTKNVTLVTAVGKKCRNLEFVERTLNKKIENLFM